MNQQNLSDEDFAEVDPINPDHMIADEPTDEIQDSDDA